MKKDVHKEVKKRYGRIAKSSGSCCGANAGCCGAGPSAEELSTEVGYTVAELASIPEGANLGLGCGNPVALGLAESRRDGARPGLGRRHRLLPGRPQGGARAGA